MRPLTFVGIVLLLLGILSFFVPVPRSESHEFKAGDTTLKLTNRHKQTLPPAVGGLLCAAGVVVLLVGSRKGA